MIEDVVDHTNVGAILRNAAALGWDGVLLAPRAADPLYRRAIKVSMGAVFSLPWARLDDWASTPERLRAAGFFTVALGLGRGGGADRGRPRRTVVPGAAAGGRPARHRGRRSCRRSGREAADVVATIAMHRGIDSLNVAAASAIACYVLRG